MARRAAQDRCLCVTVGVIDPDVHEKPVELRLGERVGAFLFDGILRGHDQEQVGKGKGLAPETHLVFGHGLEQCRLYLGGGPVDLVGQQQIVEYRPVLKPEGAVLGPVDLGTGHVARQEVGRELDAVEIPHHGAGEFLDGPCLGEPGSPFHQQVTAAQERHHQPLEQPLLPDDAAGQPVGDRSHAVLRAAGHAVNRYFCSHGLSVASVRRGMRRTRRALSSKIRGRVV